MRVLVTASTFPRRLGEGMPRFVYDLAHALSAHADVHVLAPDGPGAARSETVGGVCIHRFTYFLPRSWQRLAPEMRDMMRRSWLARLQVPFFMICQTLALSRRVRRDRPQVVNAHWLVPQGLIAAALRGGERPRFRLALHVHAGDVYFLRGIPFGRAVARFVARRSDAILADGSHVRDCLDELLGRRSGAVLQPLGVHRSTFSRLPDGQEPPSYFRDGYILFVGRLTEKKGVVYLLRALPSVLERRPDLGLVVIGDGVLRPALEEETDRLGVRNRVRFLGRLPHAEIVRHLHGSRVVAVPSIIDSHGETEGMPTVVVEAFAAGVRVVGSSVDGIPDVITHGRNGWLCREKDPADLAERILEALHDPGGDAIAHQAAETARHHDWGQVALNYLEHL